MFKLLIFFNKCSLASNLVNNKIIVKKGKYFDQGIGRVSAKAVVCWPMCRWCVDQPDYLPVPKILHWIISENKMPCWHRENFHTAPPLKIWFACYWHHCPKWKIHILSILSWLRKGNRHKFPSYSTVPLLSFPSPIIQTTMCRALCQCFLTPL